MTIENTKEINIKDLQTSYEVIISDPTCSMGDIEKILTQCENLHSLSITHPLLETLPENLSGFHNLTSLTLSFNNISEITIPLPQNLLYLTIYSKKLLEIQSETLQPLALLQQLTIAAPLRKMVALGYLENLSGITLTQSSIISFSSDILPQNLKGINLSYNSQLKTVDFSNCNNLRSILSYGNLQLQSITLSGLNNLREAIISSNTALEELDLIGSENLRRLHLDSNNENLQVLNIGSCINLREVNFIKLNTLPDGLEYCTKINSLSISHSAVTVLPNWILNFTELKTISISNTFLKNVPQNWENLTQLKSVQMNTNRIEDFNFAYSIPNLTWISIYKNPLKDPLFMLDNTKTLPTSIREYFDYKTQEINLSSFMSALAKTGFSREDREWFFHAFKEYPRIYESRGWTSFRLIQGLSIPYQVVKDKILKHLPLTDINLQSIVSFKKGSICYLDGSFTEKKSEIKAKLTALGIGVSTVLTNEVTHVILGKQPKESLRFYQQNEFLFLLEDQLYQVTRDAVLESQYLVQESIKGENNILNGLRELLTSTDPTNIRLGFEMIKTGGLPSDLIDDLVMLSKLFADADIRTEAKKIIEKQGLKEWQDILKDKQQLFNIEPTDSWVTKEILVREKLEKLAQKADKKQMFLFAMLFIKYNQLGYSYILANYPVGSEYRKQALMALTENSFFDYHKGIGNKTWTFENPNAVSIQSNNAHIPYPKDHPNPGQVKKLSLHNCNLNNLFSDIVIFENLEELDLSVNYLKFFPEYMAKLKKLRKVNLSFNYLKGFPQSLESLSNLEVLDLRHSRRKPFTLTGNSPFSIPESFFQKLPNCEVLI